MEYDDYFPISDEIPPKFARICQGCIENQPNQLAHYGGCMPNIFMGEDDPLIDYVHN